MRQKAGSTPSSLSAPFPAWHWLVLACSPTVCSWGHSTEVPLTVAWMLISELGAVCSTNRVSPARGAGGSLAPACQALLQHNPKLWQSAPSSLAVLGGRSASSRAFSLADDTGAVQMPSAPPMARKLCTWASSQHTEDLCFSRSFINLTTYGSIRRASPPPPPAPGCWGWSAALLGCPASRSPGSGGTALWGCVEC